MADSQIELARLPDGEVGLYSVLKKADGSSRFIIPLPPDMIESDPGIKYLVCNEALFGGCEYQTRRFFDAHLGPHDLFVDVGAHWGLFTLTAASLYPSQLSIIAVEADPINLLRLMKSVQLNGFSGQVEIMFCALGAQMGVAKLVRGRGTMGHVIEDVSHRRPGRPAASTGALSVPVLTLDYVLGQQVELAEKPVFLKVDVEGREVDVLGGATQLIASGRVAAMVIEKGESYKEDPELSAFGTMLDKLRKQGFKCYRFMGHNHPGPLIPYDLTPENCDIVCVSDRIKPLARYE